MTVLSAHDLTRTRLCSTPGCPDEADGDSDLCAAHERRRTRDAPPARVPVVPEADRKTCRADGCAKRSTGLYDRGVLANLCEEHEQAAREETSRKSIERHAVRRGEPTPPPPPADPPARRDDEYGRYVERARAVLEAAEKIEDAYTDLLVAERAVAAAEDEYRAKVAQL